MRNTPSAVPVGLRAELLYLTMGLCEVFWLIPYYMLLMPGAYLLPGSQLALFVALNLLLALVIIRALTRQHAPNAVAQAALVLGFLISVLITTQKIFPIETFGAESPRLLPGQVFVPPVVLTIIGVAYLWFRASRLSTILITPVRASFGLRVGISALLIVGLIPDARSQHAVILLLPFFFFFGLTATALARSASLRLNREVYRSSFGVSWVLLTLTIGSILTLIGFVNALALSGFNSDGIVTMGSAALISMFSVAFNALSPILDVIVGGFIGLLKALGLLNSDGNLAEPKLFGGKPVIISASQANYQDFVRLLPVLCFVGVAILILLAILIRVRTRRLIDAHDGEDRESIEPTNPLLGLRSLFQRRIDSIGDNLETLGRFSGRDLINARTIRRLYLRLLSLAENNGKARHPPQTPFEFEPALCELYPAHRDLITDLTRAYVDVHYGELPEDLGLINRARTALDEIAAAPPPPTTA